MAKINAIKTDVRKENEGVWVDFVLGIKLLIARARNPKYLALMQRLVDPHRQEIRSNEMDLEVLNDILKQVRAETVLLDWENIEDDKGITIPYSSEKALEFFKDPELKDFYTFVVITSENMENFKKNLVKDAEKNLNDFSDGS